MRRDDGRMADGDTFEVRPIGHVESTLVDPASAPKQGTEALRSGGVFSTRSADRPNPIGIHRTEVVAVDRTRIRVRNLEVVDGTPIVDLKPVLWR